MPVANMGQYIGAKVTPSFFENPLDGTNDWVAGITYEELTVVTYDSKLYISKKPVRDITVVPTDTEYWLEYPSGGGGASDYEQIPTENLAWKNDAVMRVHNASLFLYKTTTFGIEFFINACISLYTMTAGTMLQIKNLPPLASGGMNADRVALLALASSASSIIYPSTLLVRRNLNDHKILDFISNTTLSNQNYPYILSGHFIIPLED